MIYAQLNAYRNQLQMEVNQDSYFLNQLKSQPADPRAREKIDSEVRDRRDAYHQAILDLRKLVDSATEKYDELAKNDEVKKALTVLGKGQRDKPKLGPSHDFHNNVKLVEQTGEGRIRRGDGSRSSQTDATRPKRAREPRMRQRARTLSQISDLHNQLPGNSVGRLDQRRRNGNASLSSRVGDLGAGPRGGVRGSAAAPGDPQPEDVLKSHGLSVRRGGSTYVLAAESEIQLKLNEAQRVFKQLSLALRQQHEFDRAVELRRTMVPGPSGRTDCLETAAPGRQSTERFALQSARCADSTKSTISSACSRSKRAIPVSSKTSTTWCRNNARITFKRSSPCASLSTRPPAGTPSWPRMRPSSPPWPRSRAKSKSPFKLGPSRGFDESVKQLANREKSVLSKAVEMRRKGRSLRGRRDF